MPKENKIPDRLTWRKCSRGLELSYLHKFVKFVNDILGKLD